MGTDRAITEHLRARQQVLIKIEVVIESIINVGGSSRPPLLFEAFIAILFIGARRVDSNLFGVFPFFSPVKIKKT